MCGLSSGVLSLTNFTSLYFSASFESKPERNSETMAGSVRGVVLDESILLAQDGGGGNETVKLKSGVEYLLRKLRYSKIRTGICYERGLSDSKVGTLKRLAELYSFDLFITKNLDSDEYLKDIRSAWEGIEGCILYVVSNSETGRCLKLSTCSFINVMKYVEDDSESEMSVDSIKKLEELPMIICEINREIASDTGKCVVTVGYIMKPSREEDFARRGAFPMWPTSNELVFMPITFTLPLSSQLKFVDIILHKATDEIISVDLSNSSDVSNRISFTEGMQELKRYMEDHPECMAVDPLNNIYNVLDRLKIQQILAGLEDRSTGGRCTIRAPHFFKVDDFSDTTSLVKKLSEAKVSLPSIVKPQVACGVADAHSMAIVFRTEDFTELSVPLPVIVQEYVDHSSRLFKFYVLGEKVFYAVKKSTPSGNSLMKICEKNGLRVLHFDSLKSLPMVKDTEHCPDGISSPAGNNHSLDLELVTDAAGWLRSKLNLTIFGFDVVIQEGTGDHVIVDVNYLPSFKEVPDDTAIPAFWDAIQDKYQSTKD